MRRLSAALLDRESHAVWVPAFAGTTGYYPYEIPISPPLACSRFQTAMWPSLLLRLSQQPRQKRDKAMSTLLEPTVPAPLGDRLRDAYGVTAELLSDIIHET